VQSWRSLIGPLHQTEERVISPRPGPKDNSRSRAGGEFLRCHILPEIRSAITCSTVTCLSIIFRILAYSSKLVTVLRIAINQTT
jgi:hypothetical protein